MKVTLDMDPAGEPGVGDVLVTSRSAYLVVEARQVRSRVHPSRWALEVARVDRGDVDAFCPFTKFIAFRWHPRGRRRGP